MTPKLRCFSWQCAECSYVQIHAGEDGAPIIIPDPLLCPNDKTRLVYTNERSMLARAYGDTTLTLSESAP